MSRKTIKNELLKIVRETAPLDTGKLRRNINVNGFKTIKITYDDTAVPYLKYLNEPKNRNPKYRRTKFIGQETKGFIEDKATTQIISYLDEYYNSTGFNKKKSKKNSVRNTKTKGKRRTIIKKSRR